MDKNSFDEKLQKYKLSLEEIYYKSQEAFEQKLTVITTSALGASIFFLEKLVTEVSQAKAKWTITSSWVLLGASLFINLISHRISASNCYSTISEMNNGNYDYDTALRRHKKVDNYNKATILLLGFGILLLIVFSAVNFYSMSNQNNPPSKPPLNEKGMNPIPAPKPQTGLIPTPPPQSPPPSSPPEKAD